MTRSEIVGTNQKTATNARITFTAAFETRSRFASATTLLSLTEATFDTTVIP
jgi:hypothetical protein